MGNKCQSMWQLQPITRESLEKFQINNKIKSRMFFIIFIVHGLKQSSKVRVLDF